MAYNDPYIPPTTCLLIEEIDQFGVERQILYAGERLNAKPNDEILRAALPLTMRDGRAR